MAPYSSTLAWKIPWTKEHGGMQSLGLLRVRTLLSDFTFTFHFHALEKEMATTPVFFPGESHEQRTLTDYSPWGCKESDTTEFSL